MKKKIFAFTLTLALICALVLPALPVQAVGPSGDIPPGQIERLEHGQKRLNPHTKVQRIGTEIRGNEKWGTYEAIVSSLPTTLDDNRTLIDTNWYLQTDISGQTWFENGTNQFKARVLGGRVSVEDENGKLKIWDPVVNIGDKSYAGGIATIVDDPLNENYEGNTLKWEYGSYGGWFNFSTLTRYLRNIEGVISELWVLSGDPKASVTIQLNELEELDTSGNIIWMQAYDANYEPINITKNQFGVYVISASEFKGKEFPVTIDPTDDYTTSAYDGELFKGDANYNTARTSATGTIRSSNVGVIGQYGSEGWYTLYRFMVMFDTSDLPNDASITASALYLYGYGDASYTDFYITVQSGMPTYPHMPPQTGDYLYTRYSGDGGTYYTGGFSTSAYNMLTLNATGRSWINKTGWTKFMLRSDRDIDGDTPSGWEVVTIREYSYGINYAPELRVVWSEVVDYPTVTTLSATGVASTQSTLESRLADDGGEDCSLRFQYGTSTSYGTDTSWQSGYSTGNYFDKTIYGLSPGTTYHYRAQAMNSVGTDSGLDKTFTTPPYAPNNFTATAGDSTAALTWNKGSGADKTMIRRSTTSYPTSPSADTQIYFDTGTSHNDNTVSNGTTYYYSIWSEKSGVYSTTKVSDSATPSGPAVGEVTTNDATNVDVSTATLNLNVDDLGGSIPANVDVRFQYYYGAGNWTDNETAWQEGVGLGPRSANIDTLEAATLYHQRAVVLNDTGTAYGSDVTFTTGANSAPTPTTQAATGLQLRGATLNAAVADDGGLTCTTWFEWGLTDSYGNSTPTISGLSTDDTFYYGLTDLEPNTTYHYRAIGQNTVGIGYGDDVEFLTTTPTAPTCRTDAASNIGANQSLLNATTITDGDVECEVQFQWGTTDAYGTDTGWVEGYTKDQTFSKLITGLTVGETYHFRAQVKNAGGTGSGDDVEFTTVFSAPSEFRAKAISSTTINLSWTPQGDQTYVKYKQTGFPIDRADGDYVYMGTDEFTSISGLQAGTTYYFRAWSWREGDVWAEGYADDVATTQATMPVGEEEDPDMVRPLEEPEGWFLDPVSDNAALTKIPFYGSIVALADSYEIPEGSMWLGLAIFMTILATFLVYAKGGAFVAIFVGVVVMSACSALIMLPLWFVFIYVALGGGMMFATRRM